MPQKIWTHLASVPHFKLSMEILQMTMKGPFLFALLWCLDLRTAAKTFKSNISKGPFTYINTPQRGGGLWGSALCINTLLKKIGWKLRTRKINSMGNLKQYEKIFFLEPTKSIGPK